VVLPHKEIKTSILNPMIVMWGYCLPNSSNVMRFGGTKFLSLKWNVYSFCWISFYYYSQSSFPAHCTCQFHLGWVMP
jgi:hypothetical protein